MRAASDNNLEDTRATLEQLYGAATHEELFDEKLQWSPRAFAPLVDAAIIAAVNEADDIRDEMVQNIECLHEKFGIERGTVESIKQVVSLVDPEDSKDVAMCLVGEQLDGTELMGHLKVNEFL